MKHSVKKLLSLLLCIAVIGSAMLAHAPTAHADLLGEVIESRREARLARLEDFLSGLTDSEEEQSESGEEENTSASTGIGRSTSLDISADDAFSENYVDRETVVNIFSGLDRSRHIGSENSRSSATASGAGASAAASAAAGSGEAGEDGSDPETQPADGSSEKNTSAGTGIGRSASLTLTTDGAFSGNGVTHVVTVNVLSNNDYSIHFFSENSRSRAVAIGTGASAASGAASGSGSASASAASAVSAGEGDGAAAASSSAAASGGSSAAAAAASVVTVRHADSTSPSLDPGKTVPSDIPKTGDSANLTLWIVLMLLCAAAAAASVFLLRRKNHKA